MGGAFRSSDQSREALSPSESFQGVEAVLDATRRLFWIETPADAAREARDFVIAVGASVIPARIANENALPIDISFGEGEPLLPEAGLLSVSRMLLERHLPLFMLDAQRAIELADKTVRLAEDASLDVLTGLANRRMLDRHLARLTVEDTVIMIDLDHFKNVNDTLGHAEGDRVLKALGRTVTANLRSIDRAGRYGGEEFVLIIAGGADLDVLLKRLRQAWVFARPQPVSFSAGIAPARPDPTRALAAADRSLYRAKKAGRDQWQWAQPKDYL